MTDEPIFRVRNDLLDIGVIDSSSIQFKQGTSVMEYILGKLVSLSDWQKTAERKLLELETKIAKPTLDSILLEKPEEKAGLLTRGQREMLWKEVHSSDMIRRLVKSAQPGNLYNEAYSAIQEGHLESAEELIAILIEKTGRNELTLNALGTIRLLQQRFGEAYEISMESQVLNENDPYSLHNAGLAQAALGDDAKAENFFDKAAKYKDTRTAALAALALLYSRTNRIDESLETFEKVIDSQPNLAPAWFSFAYVLQQRKELGKLGPLLKKHWSKIQGTEIILGIASVFSGNKKDEDAKEVISLAYEIEPNEIIMGALGIAHIQCGNYSNAITMFEMMISKGQDSAAIRNNLAYAYKMMKRNQDAIGALEKAVDLDNNNSSYHLNLAIVQRDAGDSTSSALSAQTAATINPDLIGAWSLLLDVTYGLKNYAMALNATKNLQRLNPDNVDFRLTEGALYFHMGNLICAEKVYRELTKMDDSIADAYFGLGSTIRLMGRNEEAKRVFERGLEKDPNNVKILNNLAAMAGVEGNERQALKLLTRASKIETDEASHFFNMGVIYRNRKEWRKLEKSCFEGLKRDPKSEDGLFMMAHAKLEQGKLSEAYEYFKRLLSNYPHRTDIGNMMRELKAIIKVHGDTINPHEMPKE